MPLTVPEIVRLLEVRADTPRARQPVTPLAHALQCAHLAEQADASDELIVAALLHDLGYLLRGDCAHPPEPAHTADGLHPTLALTFLRGLLPEAVLAPIALQPQARRYQQQAQPGYLGQAHATDAILLSQWDDQAHVPGQPTPPLHWYIGKLEQVALPDQRGLYQRLKLLTC